METVSLSFSVREGSMGPTLRLDEEQPGCELAFVRDPLWPRALVGEVELPGRDRSDRFIREGAVRMLVGQVGARGVDIGALVAFAHQATPWSFDRSQREPGPEREVFDLFGNELTMTSGLRPRSELYRAGISDPADLSSTTRFLASWEAPASEGPPLEAVGRVLKVASYLEWPVVDITDLPHAAIVQVDVRIRDWIEAASSVQEDHPVLGRAELVQHLVKFFGFQGVTPAVEGVLASLAAEES